MAATTLLRTVNSINDTRTLLKQGSITRTLSVGSDWNKIRVGIRYNIEPGGTSLTGRKMFVGVCSGTSGWNNGVVSTTHAIGMWGPDAGNPTYYAGPPAYYDFGTTCWGAKRVGTTITKSGFALPYPYWWPAPSNYYTQGMFVQIEKDNSTTYSVKVFTISSTSAINTYFSKEDFTTMMTVPYASLTRTGYADSTAVTVSGMDEPNVGYFDTANVYFDGTINMEISDLAVAKHG